MINRKLIDYSLLFLVIGTLIFIAIKKPYKVDIYNSNKEEHSSHQGQQEHSEENIVKLSDLEIKEFDIDLKIVSPGVLEKYIELHGEIKINPDKQVNVISYLSGSVINVRKNLGDVVHFGEVMATLDSRELADAKANYLMSTKYLKLAEVTFEREEKLFKNKITSQKDYLQAQNDLVEANIKFKLAEQKLNVLRVNKKQLSQLFNDNYNLTQYNIIAPSNGIIINKHITRGEFINADTEIFIIADLSIVWAELKVYHKDLTKIKEGQEVFITVNSPDIPNTKTQIFYVEPIVIEETRTAIARAVVKNTQKQWRPGMLVSGRVITDRINVSISIPKTALQKIENQDYIFIQTEEGFKPTIIKIGRTDNNNVEIISGIKIGQKYVAKGSFTLKSQLLKETFDEGHNH